MKGGDSNRLKDYLPECTLFINGSPLGMKGSPDYQDFSFLDLLPKDAVVYDCVYQASGDHFAPRSAGKGHSYRRRHGHAPYADGRAV